MHAAKKGLRALGIAESFRGRETSTLAGVVMRKDLIVDGFALATIAVGGMDATDGILRIVRDLGRQDVNLLMLSGAVIAWYNVADPERVHRETGLPVVVVTYEDSEGLEDDLRFHFPGDDARLEAYRRLGERTEITLRGDYSVFIRGWGISTEDAAWLCRDFTRDGKVPEPLRVARLLARAVHQQGTGG